MRSPRRMWAAVAVLGVLAIGPLAAGSSAIASQSAPQPVSPYLTTPFGSTPIGHSSAGTVFASGTDFTYESRLDVISDDGRAVSTRTLPAAPPPDGTSQPRNLSVCGSTIISTRYTQDPSQWLPDATVYWYSATGTAAGSAEMGTVSVVSAAPGGWVTASSVTVEERTETALLLHSTDGSTRSLGTLPGRLEGSPVCDARSLVMASRTTQDTRVVRIPFDGSGVVVVDQRPATSAEWDALTPLGVDGSSVVWTRMPTDNNWTQSPSEVWRTSANGPLRLAASPSAEIRLVGAAIGPRGVLVCWPGGATIQGCRAVVYPPTGTSVTFEAPETSFFWPTSSGFVAACDSNASSRCAGLHQITFPGPTLRQVWQPRMPVGIVRWSGTNRYGTAADIIMNNYGPLTSSGGILASGESFPDALSAGATAARFQMPLFLTKRDRLPSEMIQPLTVMKRYRLYVVGGAGAISDSVLTDAKKYAVQVVRISGSDRYSTAAALSEAFNPSGSRTAYVVSGEDYPDGLVAAPPAAREYAPVLLTAANSLPTSTRAELVRLKPSRVVIVGGTGAVSGAVESQLSEIVGTTGTLERLAGQDRYATAVKVSRSRWADGAGSFALASGANFPDALALGPVTRGYLPLLLTGPTRLPSVTRDEAQRLRPSGVLIAGGPSVVGTGIEQELRDLPDLP